MHFNKILQQEQEQKQIQNTINTSRTTTTTTTTSTNSTTTPPLTRCERDKGNKIRETIENISDINKYTSSDDSCTSSTDSGVHINDNEAAPITKTTTTISTSSTTAIPSLRQEIPKKSKNIQTIQDKATDNSCDDDDKDKVCGGEDERHRATLNRIFDNKFRNEPPSSNGSNESNYTQQNVIEHENLINNNKKKSSDESSQLSGELSRAVVNATSLCAISAHSPPHNKFNEPTRSNSPTPSSIVYTSDSSDDDPMNPRPSNALHQHFNRSSAVSIRSIDSSVIDSDSDSDLTEAIEGVHENYVIRKLGTQVSYPPKHPDIPNINNGLQVVNHQITPHGMGGAPPTPSPMAILSQMNENFGRLTSPLHPQHNGQLASPPMAAPQIAVSASKDITIGDKHFYEGPVTIQQFLIDGRDKWKKDDNNINGKDNPSFEGGTGAPESHNNAKDINLSPTSELPKKTYVKLLLKNKKYVIPAVLITLALVISAIVLGLKGPNDNKSKKILGNSEESRQNIPINSTIGQDNVGGGKILRIVPRDGWLAQPPANPWVKLNLPLKRVVVMPTKTANCETQAACTFIVRFLQTLNIESEQQDDIIYNFLIGGDGNVYEGRGWDNRGSAILNYNDHSIFFAYIGSFNKEKPTDKQMNVTRLLLEEGVSLGKLTKDYEIVGANKLDPASITTVANALYESFKNWPHWSE